MTDKDVKKLPKVQLIELLYLLSKENDALREENQQLKSKLDALVSEMASAQKKFAAEPARQWPQNASKRSKKKRK